MGQLEVSVLGGLEVSIDDSPIQSFESDKVRALLAYLTVEADRAHRREKLIGLLWPDSPEEAARHNLRQALFNLMSNASKFTDHGTISLTVRREADDWLTFAVTESSTYDERIN